MSAATHSEAHSPNFSPRKYKKGHMHIQAYKVFKLEPSSKHAQQAH